ncbi:hypothetical protein [Athalassotoga saccharophila]|uniref:hypothetical protein n=1 Tax=Athalassotoga saccharophila TaxID=1441386 RepID=UPI00137ABDE7|nr:hypothetical protein [Athalassotoga saccharophila]BBJ29014.1 hypothetical protein ATHSA_1939 [Athalassotoga saccharophila]
MKKGYVLEAALILLIAVAIFVAAIVNFVSSTSMLRVSQEKLVIASNDAMNGLQMGTSFIAHYANSIGGFSLNFNSGPGLVPFSSIIWLQPNTSNNFFSAIYSSTDGAGWKIALSTLATGTNNVLYLNKIPAVQSFLKTLQATGIFTSTPDIVIIQTKVGGYINNSKYFVVARSKVGGSVAYASGFVVANGLNRYVYFTQMEPPYAPPFNNVTFMTGDILDGPVRTNGTLITLGNPDFKSYVQYGGLYQVPGYGSPIFESGSSQLSQSDINSMNMSMIANQYSSQINSEIASPSNLSNYSTPVGLDLSGVYNNLINQLWRNYGFSYSNNYKWKSGGYYTLSKLVSMFVSDFNYWASDSGYTDQNGNILWNQLPSVIYNDYNNVISAIYGIPSLQVTFSPGNSGSNANTITVSYGIDTSNAIAAIDHLRTDVNMYSYEYDLYSIGPYLYNGQFYSGNYYPNYYNPNVYDVLQLGYSNPQWQTLLQINPANSIPGNSKLTIESGSNGLLGLPNGSGPINFNFNGVIKTTSDLVIGDGTNQIVSGKYTLYTTRSSIINGNIIYNYANQLLGSNNSQSNWKNSPVSTSTVSQIRAATGTDALNIVSNYDIALADSMPQYAKVMASIYAFNGSFWYPNYEYAQWNGKTGQLFVFGSMAQYEGGQFFGTYSGNSLNTGYHAYYAFDWRNLSGMPSNMYGTPSAQGKALLLAVRTTF